MRLQLFGSYINQGQTYLGVSRAADELREAGFVEFLGSIGYTTVDEGNLGGGHSGRRPTDLGLDAAHQCLVSPYLMMYRRLSSLLDPNAKQIILGGDHSQSLATIPALLTHRPNTGVIWIDAHGDINTPETSVTGQLHGMPLAGLLGQIETGELNSLNFGSGVLRPENLVMIGVRDLDLPEHELLARLGVRVYTREDVRYIGAQGVIQQTLLHLRGCEDLHVSFDIDAIDPELAPTTGVPVEDGLLMDEVIALTRNLGRSGKVRSVEIVEMNPDLAANSWDWSVTVEIVKTIAAELLRPEGKRKFLDMRPSWRDFGRQFIEKAFFS